MTAYQPRMGKQQPRNLTLLCSLTFAKVRQIFRDAGDTRCLKTLFRFSIVHFFPKIFALKIVKMRNLHRVGEKSHYISALCGRNFTKFWENIEDFLWFKMFFVCVWLV